MTEEHTTEGAVAKAVTTDSSGMMLDDSVKSKSNDKLCAETNCGYLSWRPRWLQPYNKPGFLVLFIASYSLALGFVVNGVNNVNNSSIERRFDLPSANVGFLSSSYDISAAVLAVVIGYYGSGRRKARILALAVFCSALGSFVMTIPHFATDQYSLGTATKKACVEELSQNVTCSATSKSHLSNYFYVFLLGQLLHGIGGTTMFTVGISLIDDSVSAKKTPLYLGIVYGCNILGSGLGYIVGGQLLNIYVDFDTVDNINLTPSDTRWLGAWWLGPGVAACMQLLVSVPLSLFGSELPTSREVRRTRVSQAHSSGSNTVPSKLKDLKAIGITITLLRNPCFIFITLGMTVEGMVLSGTAAFLPKFVETAYGVSASRAAILTGLAVIPAAAGGLVLGGYIAKRFNLTIPQTIKFIITVIALAAASSAVIWIRCKPLEIFGVSRDYSGRQPARMPITLGAPCNNLCNCDTDLFEPVCNNDTGIYFSPCYAGCMKQDGATEFKNCRCVDSIDRPLEVSGNMTFMTPISSTLTSSECQPQCQLLYVFIPLLFFTMCLSFMPIAPGDSIQLRCMDEEHKTFAQGIKTLIVRMLGSFVGPILVGKLLDLTCKVWRERCGQRLSCWVYDHDLLATCLYLFIVICKGLAILFCCLALKFYHPPKPPASVVVESSPEEGATGGDEHGVAFAPNSAPTERGGEDIALKLIAPKA